MASPPQLSVIICHHTGQLIHRCLDSVFESEGVQLEVLVVTSAPDFQTPWAAVMVLSVQGGPAHKRNVGVSRSRHPYLVFLDDDVEVSPYCLYELWRGLQEHPKAGMGFAKIYNMERRDEFDDCGSWLTQSGFLYARAENHQRDVGQYDEPCRCLSSKSATCIIRRDIFLTAGGFDAHYYILGEETDLAWRSWLTGHESWYLPAAVSWHAFNTSLKPLADYYTLERIHRYGCRNYLSMLFTNLGTARLTFTFPLHLSAWLVACLGFALRGQWQRSVEILRGLQDFTNTMPRVRWKRRHVQASRVISDRALMQVIMVNPPWGYYFNRLRRYLHQGLHG